MARTASSAKTISSKNTTDKSAAATLDPSMPPALLDLFVDEVKDIYWAENQLVKTLPKMQQAATTKKLADAIATHLKQTQTHVSRLEQVFQVLGETPMARKCDAMEGLTKEGESIIEDTEAGSTTRDVGIIISSQKVEHYEIAAYGSLVQLAKVLGLTAAADLLAQTLEEEKQTDALLTQIAENDINYQASAE